MHACQYLATIVGLNIQFSVCACVCRCVCQALGIDVSHLLDDDDIDLDEPVRKKVPSIQIVACGVVLCECVGRIRLSMSRCKQCAGDINALRKARREPVDAVPAADGGLVVWNSDARTGLAADAAFFAWLRCQDSFDRVVRYRIAHDILLL